ncbi:MAG: response regulator [Nitrospirae bacterium]|nr:MAG: response regulator [Nitrospirota bacterium]
MGEKTKVLVVDDDRRMVRTICDILKVKGYEAAEAFSGEEAVEQVKSGHPDCVLMDIKMPGINGVEALKMIKDISPDLPIVLMSAYTTEEQVEEAKKSGAETVMTKPIDLQMVFSFLSLLRKEPSILIVDDDPTFSETVGGVLRSRGYRVETEADPENVLGHMEQDYKLAVLLDLKIGDTDGLEVLKAVRSRYPTKPVVLVTGYRDEMSASIEKGLKIGAYTCLYKPFEMEGLLDTIREIGRKKLRHVLGETFRDREE